MQGTSRRRPGRVPVLALVASLIVGPAAAVGAAHPDPGSDPVLPHVRLVPRGQRVALTFDDGPHPVWTPVLLDLLDEYDVTATFFVSGWRAVDYPDLVTEMVVRGHSVQPHGWDHVPMTGFSNAFIRNDLERNVAELMAAGAPMPTCFRPPYGATNQRVAGVAAEFGLATILWDVDSYDYVHASVEGTIAAVTGSLEAGDVILLHDLYGWIHRDSLPAIIDTVRSRGLRFDTICDDRAPQRFAQLRLDRIPQRPI